MATDRELRTAIVFRRPGARKFFIVGTTGSEQSAMQWVARLQAKNPGEYLILTPIKGTP